MYGDLGFEYQIAQESEWTMVVSAYFDESGKYKDKDVVSFGGVSSFNSDFTDFSQEWLRLLRINGLRELTCKKALKPNVPLSAKNSEIGVESRIADLLPFVACIRKHLQVVLGLAFDARSFRNLPGNYLKFLGPDPTYTAFMRALLRVLEFTPPDDRIVVVCDDEEKTAWHFYQMYRRIKRIWPSAKKQLVALSFADDTFLFGLQASDLVASIIRLEAHRALLNKPYEYHALYEALIQSPDKHERLWEVGIGIIDGQTLLATARGLKDEWEKQQAGQRIPKLRQNDAGTDKGSPRRDKSKTGRGKGGEAKKAKG